MKLLQAFAVFAGFGIILAIDFSDEYARKVQKYCQVKENASNEDVESILNGTLPETRTKKCFVACLSERYGTVGWLKVV
jgi:hypothetical protein